MLDFPVQKRDGDTLKVKSSKEPQQWLRDWRTSLKEKSETAGTVQSTVKEAQGRLRHDLNYLKEGCRGDGTKLFPEVSFGKVKRQWANIETRDSK